jgi:hypothetical protein
MSNTFYYSSSRTLSGLSEFSNIFTTRSNFSSPIFCFKKLEKRRGLFGELGSSGLKSKLSENKKCFDLYFATLYPI